MKRILYGYILVVVLFISTSGLAQQRIDPFATLVKAQVMQPDSCTMDFLMIGGSGFGPHIKVKMALSIDSVKKQATFSQSIQFGVASMFMTDSVIVQLSDLTPLYSSSSKPKDVTVLHFDQRQVRISWDVYGKNFEIEDSIPSPVFHYNFLPVLACWLPLNQGKEYLLTFYDYLAGRKNNLRDVVVKFTGYSVLKSTKVKIITAKELSGKMAVHTFNIDAVSGKMLMMEKEFEGKMSRMTREGYGD